MTGYSTYWRTTIFASIVFHFLMALGFSYVLPHLIPEPTIENVSEFEWVDVDLMPDEVVVVENEAISPPEVVQESEPLFKAQDLIIPELNIPEFVMDPIEPPPKTVEIQPPQQSATNDPPKTEEQPKVETPPKKQELGQPPVTLTEVYPEKGSGQGYKGYVSISARIGKDGKVKSTKVMRKSGRDYVDEVARKAAMQWTFRPALDQDGKPMECDKIITFNFKNFADD